MTIKLGEFDAGGGGPIWPQSDDGADCASETLAVFTTGTLALSLVVLTLLLPLSSFLSSKEDSEEPQMSPAKPSKTAETPVDELPFPGRLVDGKYDVQYLHL